METQIATLLYYMQPCILKSITKAEEQIEKRVAKQTEQKIWAVHQRIDAFELKVVERPSPSIDSSTLQVAVDSLNSYLVSILEMRGT